MAPSGRTAPTTDAGAKGVRRVPGGSGFTLLEIVIVVVVVGILAGVVGLIVQGPLRASVDTARRAALVDVAETALTRVTRELRLGVPNSIRVASVPGVVSVEMLRSLDGGRYRAAPVTGPMPACAAAPSGDPLEFTCADAQFDVLGQLPRLARVTTGAADCAATPLGADCVVVFNTGPAGANDAYAGDNTATIVAVADDAGFDGSDRLSIDNPNLGAGMPAFPLASPTQRFHIVDTPVSFVCNTAAGRIDRFFGYPITAVQSLAPGGSADLLVDNVSACDFAYDPGTATRGALVTLRVTITEPASGERVTLLDQVHVSNQP